MRRCPRQGQTETRTVSESRSDRDEDTDRVEVTPRRGQCTRARYMPGYTMPGYTPVPRLRAEQRQYSSAGGPPAMEGLPDWPPASPSASHVRLLTGLVLDSSTTRPITHPDNQPRGPLLNQGVPIIPRRGQVLTESRYNLGAWPGRGPGPRPGQSSDQSSDMPGPVLGPVLGHVLGPV